MGKEKVKSLLLMHLVLFLPKVNVPINKKMQDWTKTVGCIFLSYAIHNIGYRFLIINSEVFDMHIGTMIESREAIFCDISFPLKTHQRILSREHVPMDHNEKKPM